MELPNKTSNCFASVPHPF